MENHFSRFQLFWAELAQCHDSQADLLWNRRKEDKWSIAGCKDKRRSELPQAARKGVVKSIDTLLSMPWQKHLHQDILFSDKVNRYCQFGTCICRICFLKPSSVLCSCYFMHSFKRLKLVGHTRPYRLANMLPKPMWERFQRIVQGKWHFSIHFC